MGTKGFNPLLTVVIILIAAFATNLSAQHMNNQAQQISRLMDAFSNLRHFSGVVLVAQGGEVIFKEAYGLANIEAKISNTVDTKFWISSMSKQFTAMVAMLLVQDGKLRLDDCVSDILLDYPESMGSEINIHHLLTHTSGIIQGSPLRGAFAENMSWFNTREELRSYFQDSTLLFSPGTGYQYSNYNYSLLVMTMEKAAGMSYSELLQSLILEPLGMTSTGVKIIDSVTPPYATGYAYGLLENPRAMEITHPSMSLGAGDIYSTVDDLYRWDRALRNNELLSDSMKQIMFTAYRSGYGYGWQIGDFPVGCGGDSIPVIFHDGASPGYESIIIRIPQSEQLVIILSNGNEPWLHMRLARPRHEIAPAILAILHDYEYKLPKKSAAYAIAVEDTLSEDYDIEQGFAELMSSRPQAFSFDPEEFYCIGLSYAWKRMFDKARSFLKIAVEDLGVEHLPNAWQCYNVYGESLFMMDQIDASCAQFERSLKLKPGNSYAIKALRAAKEYKKANDQ